MPFNKTRPEEDLIAGDNRSRRYFSLRAFTEALPTCLTMSSPGLEPCLSEEHPGLPLTHRHTSVLCLAYLFAVACMSALPPVTAYALVPRLSLLLTCHAPARRPYRCRQNRPRFTRWAKPRSHWPVIMSTPHDGCVANAPSRTADDRPAPAMLPLSSPSP